MKMFKVVLSGKPYYTVNETYLGAVRDAMIIHRKKTGEEGVSDYKAFMLSSDAIQEDKRITISKENEQGAVTTKTKKKGKNG